MTTNRSQHWVGFELSCNKSHVIYWIPVLTDHAAPMRKLIRIRMSTAILGCAHWETVIPEDPKRALDSVVPVAGDKLLVVYIEDVKVGSCPTPVGLPTPMPFRHFSTFIATKLADCSTSRGCMLFLSQIHENIVRIPLGIGTVSQCYADREDTEAFFSFNSFLEPPTFYRADFSQVEKTSLLQLEQVLLLLLSSRRCIYT
jgi:hypothetical protein